MRLRETGLNHTPTQGQCDRINALREFEVAHKQWMDTPRWTPAEHAARAEMYRTKEAYLKAIRLCPY